MLITDDERLIRWSIVQRLQQRGFRGIEAVDARECLQKVGDADAVILDYRLPDRSGFDVLRELRRSRPDTPVIMLTAHASVEHAVEAMKLADSPNDPGAGEPSAGGGASQDTPADDTLDRLRALARALHEEMLRKPHPPEELPAASSTDPETGITTTSQKNPDGSRTITRTDPDGNVLSTETVPPRGEGGGVCQLHRSE
ncbi:MAG: response regulator, partial [Sandaracinaceae bacterium]|nr:response regulator [Sandaracinaceae bacterium]